MPTKDVLFLFLNKRNFLTTSLDAWQIRKSHIINVSEVLMLNAIYHYYKVSGEINFLYLLHTILLLLLCPHCPLLPSTVLIMGSHPNPVSLVKSSENYLWSVLSLLYLDCNINWSKVQSLSVIAIIAL
jgi:hypothetical protein